MSTLLMVAIPVTRFGMISSSRGLKNRKNGEKRLLLESDQLPRYEENI